MGKNLHSSSYRFVMGLLVFLGMFAGSVNWVSPAAILGFIMPELGIDIGQAGLTISILSLAVGLSGLVGSTLMDKMGVKMTAFLSVGCITLGALLGYWSNSYAILMLGRCLIGVGLGLYYPILGVIGGLWFPEKERAYFGTMIMVAAYLSMTVGLMAAVPIYNAVGTWQRTLGAFGIYCLVVFVLWLFLARFPQAEAAAAVSPTDAQAKPGEEKKEAGGMAQAVKVKEVWLVCVMMIGIMWVWNIFPTYLPTFLTKVRGFDPAAAGNVTGSLMLAGLIGALVTGVLSGKIGKRKPFTWPYLCVIMIAGITALYSTNIAVISAAVMVMGFAVAGFSVIYLSIPMDLPISPVAIGGAIAIINSLSYGLGFFAPMIFGFLEPRMGMLSAMVANTCVMLVAIAAGFVIKETAKK